MTRIVECGRTFAGALVAFDISWEGDLGDADVAWTARVQSHDGEQLQLVLERRRGEGLEQYAESAGRRDDVDLDADVRDDDVIVRFPAAVVGAAVEWPVWTAVLTVDGRHVSEQHIPLRG